MTAKRRRPQRAIPAKHPDIASADAPVEVVTEATALAALVRREIQELGNLKPSKSAATRTQRQNQLKRCADILRKLGSVTGESSTMPESKVVRHPAFRRVVEDILRALEKYPEALAAVGQALTRLERGEPAERDGGG